MTRRSFSLLCVATAVAAFGWSSAAQANFSYHDNRIKFSVSEAGSLVSGSYTIEDLSITDGQDPDHKISVGLTTTMDSEGVMSFRVGRSKSEDVATWFNSRIPAARTTFNHKADDLNFAFLGTLTLTLTGGMLGNNRDTYTFSGIGLAQGSNAGASNNWWFGGQNCMNVSADHVFCRGKNSSGSAVAFVFLRGGNGVNAVGVTPSTPASTMSWMGRIKDATALDQLVMPGSHDAGMSEAHHCTFSGSGPYVLTQRYSVFGQLLNGSRYFDIRVDFDHGQLVTYHRTDSIGCNGQDFETVLNQTVEFLSSNPAETAIIKISQIRSDRGDGASIKTRINRLLSERYGNSIYINKNLQTNLAGIILGEVRGKAIMVFDYTEYINPEAGRFRYMDGVEKNESCATKAGANLTVCDSFSNTSSYDKMKTDQLNKWNKWAAFGTGHLFLLSWTLTSTPPDPDIKTLAGRANSKLPGVLHDQIVNLRARKPNIVYIDFLDSPTAESIIRYNF